MNAHGQPRFAAVAVLLAGMLLGGAALAQDDLSEATRLNQRAVELHKQGRAADAIEPARRALAIRERALGAEHPTTATSLNNLAAFYEAAGQYAQALPLHQRALAIREKLLGAEHPATATSLNNLAANYVATGQYALALPLLQRALTIIERRDGSDHPSTAASLNNLAALYDSTGQYAQALPLHQRALAIREKALGPEHPETALSLNSLAMLYVTTGQYAQALPLLKRALAINEKALGSEHPETATSLNNLAFLFKSIGQYTSALPLYRRALAVHEKVLGAEHPATAASVNNLASLYESIGRYAQALPLYQRALAISEKALGPAHPKTAASLNNLAGLYEKTGQRGLALPLRERALEITEAALGPEHPETAVTLSNLALSYVATGQYSQALPLYQRALLISQSANDPGLLWTVNGNLMAFHAPEQSSAESTRNVRLAIWHGKQAINALQPVSSGLREVDARMQRSFLKSNAWYYTRLSELLVQEGRIGEAEQVLAMLKERELSELIQRSDVRKTQADEVGVERRISRESAELAARGAKYSSELAALERKDRLEDLSADEKARRDELRRAAQRWRDEYQRWLAGLADVFAQSRRSDSQTEDASSALQTHVRAEAGAVGLQYIVGDERIAIIVNTARGSFGRFSNVRRSVLYEQIAALRQAIVARTDVLPAAQALHKTLIDPVSKDLEDAQATTLVLALTDTLRYVPFAALHDGQRFLIERHPIALYASAGGGEAKAGGAPWRVAALGLTQARLGYVALPAVQRELEGIVRTEASPQGVLPGRISLDEAFDSDQLDDALRGRYNVVHVASHFNLSLGDESRSVLVTGRGEPISLRDLTGRDYHQVEQLTLSACETGNGGGTNENGREVEGLAAAVQHQGAKAVLATLWSVADASTAQLMRSFYAQRAQSSPPARAIGLQRAQLALLRGGASDTASDAQRSGRPDAPVATAPATAPAAEPGRPYAHPYFWAPFVLSGNWL